MDELKIFNYRNVLPVNRTSSFLLTLLYLSPFPFKRTNLLYLLKPFCSDKEVAALLNDLVKDEYLYEENGYYALTSKPVTMLDIYNEKYPHRKRAINIENLSVYEIKSFIVVQALLNAVTPMIQEIGHWPKNERERMTLQRCMINHIQSKSIPFLKGYNTAVYEKTISKTRYLREYEINSLYLSKLYAQLNASAIKSKANPAEAQRYQRIYQEITQIQTVLEQAAPLTQMLTYTDGLKILTLSILEQNGLLIEGMTDTSITIGIINSASNGITNYRLRKKLDYAVTFANSLGLEPSINIYAAETHTGIIEKQIEKLNAPFILPSITVKPIPQKLPTRTAYLKQLLS